MPGDKKKSLDWSITALLVKTAVLVITIGIGLWMGHSSYDAFYIAAFIQAVNNMYDDSAFFKEYTRWITVYHIVSFLGSLGCLIVFFVHLQGGEEIFTDTDLCMYIVAAILSLPILYLLIELYKVIREERY